jgi:hypothetical protein
MVLPAPISEFIQGAARNATNNVNFTYAPTMQGAGPFATRARAETFFRQHGDIMVGQAHNLIRNGWRPWSCAAGRIDPAALCDLVDAVLTIAVTLCNEGLLSREALAVALDETARQQEDGGEGEARKAPVAALRDFFRLPLAGDQARARLQVIAGDRPPDADWLKLSRWH